MMRKLSGWCVTAGVVGAFLLNASGALAQHPDKCQKAIAGAASLYEAACTGALRACADAVQAANVKNAALAAASKPAVPGNMVTAAKTCETKLAGVYDYAGAKPGKSSAAKFRAAVNKPFTKAPTPDCTAADLATLNELVAGPGGNAPGTNPQDFLADWLLFAKEKVCIKEILFDYPTILQQITEAVTATESKPLKGDNTSCNSADVPPVGTYRPNLCAWGPECYDHACTLSAAANATIRSGTLDGGMLGNVTVPLSGTTVIEVCEAGPSPLPVDQSTGKPIPGLGAGAQFGTNPQVLYLINEPGKTINPIATVIAGTPIHVCVSGIVSQGWCDCSGGGLGVNINTSFCQDRIAGAGPNDGCGELVSGATADVSDQCGGNACPGTKVGKVHINPPAGPSTPGDCVDLNTTQFKILMDGDAPAGDRGADNKACTNDDTVAASAPAPIPLTTGSAQATMIDAVESPGNCAGAPNGQCVSDADCGGAAGAGPCNAGLPVLETFTTAPVTGAKTNCANYRSSNLGGLSFAGAFPAAGGKLPLGDSATTFHLICQ
jgi:hypothetical protein